MDFGQCVWLALRVFYLYGVFNYMSSAPPILKVTIGGDAPCSVLDLQSWRCQSCLLDDAEAAAASPFVMRFADDGATAYTLSNPRDLAEGADVVFGGGTVRVRCEWRGLPQGVYAVMVAVGMLDVSRTVLDSPRKRAAETLTWVATAAIAYKAFHFAFVF